MSFKRLIWVTTQRVGWHAYPFAPDQVSYLRSRHRHLFKIKVTVSVEHEDREIEFHMFLTWLEHQLGNTIELNNRSCESLAEEILNNVRATYGSERYVAVEVSEDGECGAIVSTDE